MANEYVNKVLLASGAVLIDLTGDDVTAADVLYGKKFHLPSGANGVGSCTYDSDTTDADAVASEILSGKYVYVNKSKIQGSMPNRGAATLAISTKAQQAAIPNGYHDGSGYAEISDTEQAKIIATNIRQGVTILGVEGSMSGTEDVVSTTGTVTPSLSSQTKLPTDFDAQANFISQVTINAIPIAYVDNIYGGQTCTIG